MVLFHIRKCLTFSPTFRWIKTKILRSQDTLNHGTVGREIGRIRSDPTGEKRGPLLCHGNSKDPSPHLHPSRRTGGASISVLKVSDLLRNPKVTSPYPGVTSPQLSVHDPLHTVPRLTRVGPTKRGDYLLQTTVSPTLEYPTPRSQFHTSPLVSNG